MVKRARIAHGAELVWLIDPARNTVEIYRPDDPVEVLDRRSAVGGEGSASGIALNLPQIWK